MYRYPFPDMGIPPPSFWPIDSSFASPILSTKIFCRSTKNFRVVSQKKCLVILTKTGLKQILITKMWKNERPRFVPLTFIDTVEYHQNILYEIDVGEKTCLKNCYELKM